MRMVPCPADDCDAEFPETLNGLDGLERHADEAISGQPLEFLFGPHSDVWRDTSNIRWAIMERLLRQYGRDKYIPWGYWHEEADLHEALFPVTERAERQ